MSLASLREQHTLYRDLLLYPSNTSLPSFLFKLTNNQRQPRPGLDQNLYHGVQQHSKHRPGQETGRAAEDGGQHRQDKGVQSSSRLNVVLRSPCQRGPTPVASACIRKPF